MRPRASLQLSERRHTGAGLEGGAILLVVLVACGSEPEHHVPAAWLTLEQQICSCTDKRCAEEAWRAFDHAYPEPTPAGPADPGAYKAWWRDRMRGVDPAELNEVVARVEHCRDAAQLAHVSRSQLAALEHRVCACRRASSIRACDQVWTDLQAAIDRESSERLDATKLAIITGITACKRR